MKAAAAVVACLGLAIPLAGCGIASPSSESRRTVVVGSAIVSARVAATPASRSAGLSHTPPLKPGTGMLFRFPKPARQTIWMLGMRYPLDVVWIARSRVAGVVTLARPHGWRIPVAAVRVPSDAVLELPAGYARRHHIARGSRVAGLGPAGS